MSNSNPRPENPHALGQEIYQLALDLACARLGVDAAARALPHFPARAQNPVWRRAADARRVALYLARTLGNLRGYELAAAAGMTQAAVCIACREVEAAREHPGCNAVIETLEAAMRPALDRLRPEADFLESLARAARADWEVAA